MTFEKFSSDLHLARRSSWASVPHRAG